MKTNLSTNKKYDSVTCLEHDHQTCEGFVRVLFYKGSAKYRHLRSVWVSLVLVSPKIRQNRRNCFGGRSVCIYDT